MHGFLFSGKGLLVGFLILLIPYLLGGMGAGDVKLMAAIGAIDRCFIRYRVLSLYSNNRWIYITYSNFEKKRD